MRQALDIAIVGAGVSGLAAASLLARAGHRVVLYERFDESRPIGSGLMLQPTGLAALARLGLRERIEARGERIDRLHGITDRGTTIFDLAYGDLDTDNYAVAVHRAALHGALWESFCGSPATLETTHTITAIETLADGKVALRDETARLSARFALVIDASGARSSLRRFVTGATARPFRYGAVWASVPDIGIAQGRLAQRYVEAKIMTGYLPVGQATADGPRLAALFWSLKPHTYQHWRENFTPWREQIVALWPELSPVIDELTTPDHLTLATYWQFTASRPFRGPVALIGDSAHATSPQLGQGANTGMLDALALADAIAASNDVADALNRYARFRRAHVRFYQLASAIMTPFFQSDSRLLATTRDLTFHRMKIVPYLHMQMLRTLAGLKTGIFTHGTPAALAGGGNERS